MHPCLVARLDHDTTVNFANVMKVLKRMPSNDRAYRVVSGKDDCLEYKLLKLLTSGKRVVITQIPLKDARYFERFYQGRQVNVRVLKHFKRAGARSPGRTMLGRAYFDPQPGTNVASTIKLTRRVRV